MTQFETDHHDKDDSIDDYGINPDWRKAALLALVGTVVVLAVYWSPMRATIDDGFTRKIEYSLRSAIGKSPPLDPRIKMIAFDDYTAGILQRPDLTLADWALIFEYLAKNKPKVIFVDRIFGLPLGSSLNQGISANEAEEFIARMQNLKVPIVVGSFFQTTKIVQRTPLTLDRNAYRLDELNEVDQTLVPFADISWLEPQEGYVYGPHPLIAAGFSRIGHINNEGSGYIRPVVRVSDQHVMAHSAIMSVGDLRFAEGAFYVDQYKLPIPSTGRLVLNLSDREAYYGQTKNLLSFIRKINNAQDDFWIEPGDFVAVLPMMYTGNTDMKEVPIGRLQGSYVNISALNNVLSENWLKESPLPMLTILICGLLGAVLGTLFPSTLFSLSLVFFAFLQVILGLAAFSYANTFFPWPFMVFATFLCGGVVFIEKAKKVEDRKRAAVAKAQEGIQVRKLLHVVCHDIANPLMVVTTRTKMMGGDHRKLIDDERNASNIDKIAFAAEKVRNIINAVRDLEAVETGKATIELSPVSLKAIFTAVYVSFEDRLTKKGISLKHNLEGDQPDILVLADHTSLENFVIHNLVSNAIKFSSEHQTIYLTAVRTEGHVSIKIRDEGIGIPEEILGQIFSSTASTTRMGTGNERGTGFGMPIVKSYVQKFGGTVTITSKTIDEFPEDHGTEITITIGSHNIATVAGYM